MSQLSSTTSPYSRVIHLLACGLTFVVFFLIWVGGLVTTYDAGMAVPDWPGTYGWNMFAYPASTWLFGPFDLLVEHGHRLLASLSGLISIFLVIAAYRWEQRVWFRRWCVFILLAVIAQGVLGGARVLFDERTFAMIHGCTGPLFFAIATATAVMCSRWWRTWPGAASASAGQVLNDAEDGEAAVGQKATGRGVRWLATALVVLSYTQLVIGAQLRHVTGAVPHKLFKGFVHLHLGLAAVVLLLAIVLAAVLLIQRKMTGKIRLVAQLLAFAVLCQVALGIGTWVVNYALPWSELNDSLAGYTISAKGYWESMIVTAHVATGSLIISLATVVTLRSWRSQSSGTAT
ncbi:MAG: COX15/CtaA family protein [Planctomycetota bacterium]